MNAARIDFERPIKGLMILLYAIACLSLILLVLLIAASASLPNAKALAERSVRGCWTRTADMRGFVFLPEPETDPEAPASETAAADSQ